MRPILANGELRKDRIGVFAAPGVQRLEQRVLLATIIVNDLGDTVAVDGHVTLREAVRSANSNANVNADVNATGAYGADTITFSPTLGGTITLGGGELAISGDLTLTGPGAAKLAVSGNNLSRVLSVSGAAVTARIDGIAITQGNSIVGGGILNNGVLTLTNSTVSRNRGSGIQNNAGTVNLTNCLVAQNTVDQVAGGGGINNVNGTVTLLDTVVSDNTAGGAGGGIFNSVAGTLAGERCTISGNSTAGSGGGINNSGVATFTHTTIAGNRAEQFGGGGVANSGTLTLITSTVSGNVAGGNGGGGIQNAFDTLTVVNSAISLNSTTGSGGGIVNGGPLTLTNVTVSGNTANFHGGGIDTFTLDEVRVIDSTIAANRADGDGNGSGIGGGIDLSSGTLLANTLVAGNYRGAGTTASDIAGTAGTSSHNLIGTGGSGGLVNGVNGNLVGVANANLGPLADNGGLTPTHALLAGSAAIDAGDNALIPAGVTTDQRGAGFARIAGPRVDIGAFERDATPPTVAANSFQVDTLPQSVRIRFSESVNPLLLAGGLSVVTLPGLAASPVQPPAYDAATNAVTFPLGPLADGNYRATLKAANVKDSSGNALAADVTFDFFVLAGDATRDRVVNFDDLLVLAKNYNKTGASFTQGDFTGDGLVNFDDLLVLAKNYNKAVPTAGATPEPAAAMDVQALAAAMGIAAPTTTTKPARPAPAKKPPVSPKPAPKPTPVVRDVPPAAGASKAPPASVLRDDDKAKAVFSTTRVAKPTPVKAKVVAKAKGR